MSRPSNSGNSIVQSSEIRGSLVNKVFFFISCFFIIQLINFCRVIFTYIATLLCAVSCTQIRSFTLLLLYSYYSPQMFEANLKPTLFFFLLLLLLRQRFCENQEYCVIQVLKGFYMFSIVVLSVFTRFCNGFTWLPYHKYRDSYKL